MDPTQAVEYVFPASVDEALGVLRERGDQALLVAGGIEAALSRPGRMRVYVDISRLPLSYVQKRDNGIAVGAVTTMTSAVESPLLREYLGGIVPRTLRRVASPLLRNLATIGGSVVRAHPWSDVITLFLALDGRVVFYDGTHTVVSLSDVPPFQTRRLDRIVTEVVLPLPPPNAAASFVKFSRTECDVATLNCACFVRAEEGRCAEVRIAVGGTPSLARRALAVEAELIGKILNAATIEAAAARARNAVDVREDRRSTAEYRRVLVDVGVKRCLGQIAEQLGEGAG